jgi:hypothetical protein
MLWILVLVLDSTFGIGSSYNKFAKIVDICVKG